jgi:hypothetical protein
MTELVLYRIGPFFPEKNVINSIFGDPAGSDRMGEKFKDIKSSGFTITPLLLIVNAIGKKDTGGGTSGKIDPRFGFRV